MTTFLCLSLAVFWSWPTVAVFDNRTTHCVLVALTNSAASKLSSGRGHAGDSAEQASCRKFVRGFYAWYLARSKKGDPLRVALRLKKAAFSPELVRRLREDYAAASKSPGEIVGLDFDPVLNSQDIAEKYVPGKVTQNGRRFLVEVSSDYTGQKAETVTVTPELRHEHGQWVFTNFLYKSDGKSDDLLSILAKLKAERKKGK